MPKRMKRSLKNSKKNVDRKNFDAFINDYPVLKNYKSIEFSAPKISGSTAKISGILTTPEGAQFAIGADLVSESGQWKVQLIKVSLEANKDTEEPFFQDVKTGSGFIEGKGIQKVTKEFGRNDDLSITGRIANIQAKGVVDISLWYKDKNEMVLKKPLIFLAVPVS